MKYDVGIDTFENLDILSGVSKGHCFSDIDQMKKCASHIEMSRGAKISTMPIGIDSSLEHIDVQKSLNNAMHHKRGKSQMLHMISFNLDG